MQTVHNLRQIGVNLPFFDISLEAHHRSQIQKPKVHFKTQMNTHITMSFGFSHANS